MNDKVSIVIPYYNDGDYIFDAVDSIRNQTHNNFEIIVVNDGSTEENSLNILQKLGNIEPDIKIIHKLNGGLSSARNVGFQQATSEYVLTLDADDMFEATFVEKALFYLKNNPKCGGVSSYIQNFGKNNAKWIMNGGVVRDFLVKNNSVSCALIRNEAWKQVGGYDETFTKGYEDWDFWISITKLGWYVYIIPEYLFMYRQKAQSMILETKKQHKEIFSSIVYKHKELYINNCLDLIIELSTINLNQIQEISHRNRIIAEIKKDQNNQSKENNSEPNSKLSFFYKIRKIVTSIIYNKDSK